MNMTEGNIKKIFIRFALPIILSLVSQQLYNVIDMIIVGKFLGVKELAAVGNAGTIVTVLITLSGGLEMGCEVLFAKYIGSKKNKDIIVGVKSILFFGLISGIVITLLGMLLKAPILTWIKVPEELITQTGVYYSTYLAGITCIFLYDISRAILIALGNAKVNMILVIATSLLNVILDLFFICVLKMGVGGAALATVLSQIAGMVITLLLLRKRIYPYSIEYPHSRIQLKKVKEVLTISLPTIFQQFLLSVSSMLLVALVNPYGSDVISGFITANKIMLFGMLAIIGISQTLSVFTASNYGAENYSRIKIGYQLCMKFASFFIIIIVGVNFIFPGYLIGAFLDSKVNVKAYEFARSYLWFSSLTYFFTGWKIVNESIFRGYLRMKEYLISNLSDLLGKVLFTYSSVWLFSYQGFWIGGMLGKMISFAISMFIIKKSGMLGVKESR